jgi:hypothetical protein
LTDSEGIRVGKVNRLAKQFRSHQRKIDGLIRKGHTSPRTLPISGHYGYERVASDNMGVRKDALSHPYS